ncbi:MAG: ribosome silencing factor [Bacteroidota bacterium]
MNSQVKFQKVKQLSAEELNDLIIDSIQDIKGQNIVKLDLTNLDEAPTDYFIICEGESNTQVKAICDNIAKRTKQEAAVKPSSVEGQQNAMWICMDFFNTVVHIFYKEKRAFYELESLWSDANFTEYASL